MLRVAIRLRQEAEALAVAATGFRARATMLRTTDTDVCQALTAAPLAVRSPRSSASLAAWHGVADVLRPSADVLDDLARRTRSLAIDGAALGDEAARLETTLVSLDHQRARLLASADPSDQVRVADVEAARARTRRSLAAVEQRWAAACRVARYGIEAGAAQLGAIRRAAAPPRVGPVDPGRLLDSLLARGLLYVPPATKHLRWLSGGAAHADAWMRAGHIELNRAVATAGGLLAAPLRGAGTAALRYRTIDPTWSRAAQLTEFTRITARTPATVLDEASAAVLRADAWARRELDERTMRTGGPQLPTTPRALQAAVGAAGVVGLVGDLQVVHHGSQYTDTRGQVDEAMAFASLGGVGLAVTAKTAGTGAALAYAGKLTGLVVLGALSAPVLAKIGLVAGGAALAIGVATGAWGVGNFLVDAAGQARAARTQRANRPSPSSNHDTRRPPTGSARTTSHQPRTGPRPNPSATSVPRPSRPPGPPLADPGDRGPGFTSELDALRSGRP